MTTPTDADEIDAAHADAETMADTGTLGYRQAEVYALRELHDVGRAETADILDLSPNTVDNHLAAAEMKIRNARALVNFLESPK